MGDAWGEFFFVVGDHKKGFVLALAEGFYNVFGELTVGVVKSVEGFVKNEEFWIFYKGSGE